ncbi:DEAD/DEAH box helicase [Candidatus Micrarchaeota archaeon]|nr:DEAD/DEAH box helicase [Candidatus Micrarchaeota archaeon]
MNLKFSEQISRALGELGFREMTEVQHQAIPFIQQGEDIIVQARTGTGKTAAFAIPLLEMVDARPSVQVLVLVPTRELAIQVGNDFRRIGKYSSARVLVAYGGTGIESQIERLHGGVQIVVGTPGRIMDLMERRALDISRIGFFVLDEADVMLAMGFIRDVERIIASMPHKKQVLMFCVDFPEEVIALAKRHMRYPQHVKLISSDKSAQGVKQVFYLVPSGRKLGVLLYLLNQVKPSRALIFCKTKRRVDELTRQLNFNGFPAKGIQGDLTQTQRTRTMQEFKDGLLNILVATDVAARGIHVEKISHVFNYELPHDINYYIHRIGRTGRMADVGEAITLCYSDEMGTLGQIERLMGKTLEEKTLPQGIPAPKMPPYVGGGRPRHYGGGGRPNYSKRGGGRDGHGAAHSADRRRSGFGDRGGSNRFRQSRFGSSGGRRPSFHSRR